MDRSLLTKRHVTTLVKGSIHTGVEFRTLIINPYHLILTIWYQSPGLVEPACVFEKLLVIHFLIKIANLFNSCFDLLIELILAGGFGTWGGGFEKSKFLMPLGEMDMMGKEDDRGIEWTLE